MPPFSRPVLRFMAGVVMPAILVLAGAAAAVLLSLDRMADTVNTTELTLTRKSVEAAFAATLRRMTRTVRDYAQWDDATRNLYGTPDPTFVSENFADSTAAPTFFDTAYLLASDGSDILGYSFGAPTRVPAVEAIGAKSLESMIAALPKDGRTFGAESALVSGASGLMLVAVAPVVPVSAEMPVPPGGPRFLVIGKRFEQALIDGLAEDYVIDGLKIGPPDRGGPSTVPLADREGKIVASLTWRPQSLGTAAQAHVGPVALTMLGFVAVTIGVLSFIAIVFVGRLERGEIEAKRAARTDSLTGLANRAALIEALQGGLSALGHGGAPIAVVYVDLDGFKDVNDLHGHATGDGLLRALASRLRDVCGNDLVARLGGDEFVAVTVGRNAKDEAVRIGERVIATLRETPPLGRLAVSISASIGIVEASSGGISVDELLRRADVAMYDAKRQGRGRICVYARSLEDARVQQSIIAADLARAIVDNSLALEYQPIVDARSGRMVAVEALVRWTKNGEAIPPEIFVAIAEESGLIDQLGTWTLRKACADASLWPGIGVAVNVSPAQLRNAQFAALVGEILRDSGFAPEKLELEITENSMISRPDEAGEMIDALRRLGIRLALDDFGSGYSSIGFLRRFRFDKVKIDRGLITEIDRRQQSQGLVRATIHIAETLGLSVTAEGIETEAEALILKAAGCSELQGFYFGRPVPAAQIAARARGEMPLLQTA